MWVVTLPDGVNMGVVREPITDCDTGFWTCGCI